MQVLARKGCSKLTAHNHVQQRYRNKCKPLVIHTLDLPVATLNRYKVAAVPTWQTRRSDLDLADQETAKRSCME